MAKIQNIVETRFTTTGAQKTAKDTDNVGRAQTRMGQASASSGRAFAAQASGLGGLVAAYAGAAATIFAVTAAFQALSRAAQAEQTIQGTRTLALEVGASGNQILKSIQDITKGQLSLAEASQNLNIGLSAGFNTEQIERLSLVSLKASRALGRNLTDALQRLLRGTAKLEPELLDELGIFTRIEPAVQRYAAELGKAATSLTNFERRQAFVNAAIEEGERKFGIISVSGTTSQESFEKLSASIQDLAQQVGSLAADFLSPLADFFSGSLGTALLAFGILARLVFAKTGEIIGGFVKTNVARLERFADAGKVAVGSIAKVTEANERAMSSAAGFSGRFATGSAGLNVSAGQAIDRAAAGGVGRTQQLQDIKTLNQAKEAEKQYRREVYNGTRAVKDKEAAIARSIARTKVATAVTSAYGVSTRGAGAANLFLAKTAVVARGALTGLGVVLGGIMSFLNGLFLVIAAVQLVGTLFDRDILGGIVKFFKELGKESRDLEKGLAGVVDAAQLGDLQMLETLKKNFKAKELEKIGEDAREAIQKGMSFAESERLQDMGGPRAVQQFEGSGRSVSATSADAKRRATEFLEQTEAGRKLREEVERLNGVLTIQTKQGSRTAEIMVEYGQGLDFVKAETRGLRIVQQELANAEKELQEARAENNASLVKEKLAEVQSYKLAEKAYKDGTVVFGQLIAEFNELTGVQLPHLAKAFTGLNSGFEVTADGALYFANQIGELGDISGEALATMVDGRLKLTAMGRTFVGAVGQIVQFNDLATRTQESFRVGAIGGEKMSQSVGGLDNIIKQLNEEMGKLSGAGEDVTALEKRIKELSAQRDEIKKLSEELNRLEAIGRVLNKTFSAELKAFSEAASRGQVSLVGDGLERQIKFADTQTEINKNKREFLSNQLEELAKATDLQKMLKDHGGLDGLRLVQKKGIVDLTANEETLLQNADTTTRAIIGGTAKLNMELFKVNKQIEKMEVGLKQAAENLTLKGKLGQAQQQLQKITADAARNAALNSQLKNIADEIIKSKQLEIAANKQNLELEKQRADIAEKKRQSDLASATAQNNLLIAQAQGRGGAAIGTAQNQLADMQRFENLNTAQEIRDKQREIIALERSSALEILKLRQDQANLELQAQREAAQAANSAAIEKQASLLNEQILLSQEKNMREQMLLAEQQIARDNIQVEIEKNKAQEKVTTIQSGIAAQAAMNRAESLKLQATQLKTQADLIKDQAEMFKQAIDGLAEVFNVFAAAVEAETGQKVDRATVTNTFEDIIQRAGATSTRAEGLTTSIDANRDLELKNINAKFNADEKIRKADLAGLQTRKANLLILQDLQRKNFAEERKQAEAKLQSAIDTAFADGKITAAEIKNIETLQKVSDQKFQNERDAINRTANTRLDALAREEDSIRKVLDAISEKIQNRLGGAVEDFFGAIREGTLTMENFKQGVKDLFVGILEDVTTSITDEFVINPIKEFVKEGIGNLASMFGGGASPQSQVVSLLQQQLGTQQTAAQTAQSSFNALEKTFADQMSIFEGLGLEVQRVQVVGGVGGIGSPVLVTEVAGGESSVLGQATEGLREGQFTKNLVKEKKAEAAQASKGAKVVQQTSKAQGTLAQSTADVTNKTDGLGFSFESLADFAGMAGAGLGALAGGLIGGPAGSAIGGIVGALAGSLIKSIDFSSLFSFASGGGVRQMASGGMLRDRVPALLEPGEFVIRKPMAKAIGGPALNAMNAHGQMPNTNNVVVNMNNQGTPQENVEQPNISVTPEGLIVDIITRDLRNNGPIRRGIRGTI